MWLIKFILFFSCLESFGEVIIKGHIIGNNPIDISYKKPFTKFANRYISTPIEIDSSGSFSIKFKIAQEMSVEFSIGNKQLLLFVEPNDLIELTINNQFTSKDAFIYIVGNNAKAIYYYNFIYDRNRMDKFEGIQNVFTANLNIDANTLFGLLKIELQRQTCWLDSLHSKGGVSSKIKDHLNTEIYGLLAWEITNLCDQYLTAINKDSGKDKKRRAIKNLLFEFVNPLSPALKTCLSSASYYYSYFSSLNEVQQNSIDKELVIIESVPFFSIAPHDIQGFLWGTSIFNNMIIAPNATDYCLAFKKYERLFEDGPFVEYFKQSDVCFKKDIHKVATISSFDGDLFSLISQNFESKRIFIDLWATWCAPCKVEFSKLDSSFYSLMKIYNIELVYISLDKPDLKPRWERDVNSLNLSGHHFYAENKLQSSIKEIVFDNETIVIPRYLLVNEKGVIVSTDFLRPSNGLFADKIKEVFGIK
jgi:thiol-disulfide isomerase/thioredoxin